jgi:maltose alpha-D-glucosyltransferase/alpha-amylase
VVQKRHHLLPGRGYVYGGNGDGIGDFEGLMMRLDQFASIGITCIWLLPFYPTPNRDNGYDVSDYYNVDPRLGTLGDFVEFVNRAQGLGIRVMVDLVVNHTSIDHPWFQSARQGPDSKYHDWYVWSKEKPKKLDEGTVFPGVQDATWTYDEKAKAWYFHRFYWHQPDLNIANPAVRDEILKIMGFWIQLGVSGFRVDAAPFLIELKTENPHDIDDPHNILKDMRHFLSWRRGDAIILAEANVEMKKIPPYFGDGDKLQMLFNFLLNQHIFLALARGKAEPIVEALQEIPPIPNVGQWAIFLRNHDELSLDKLTKREREQVYKAFGPEPEMQIYDRGIRRRLAPMLKNDRRCLELAYSLLLTLPGTPVLWYGDEIGMGDDLSQEERNSVRTPMQWADEKNGGFSTAAPRKLVRPVISQGEFGYQKVNFDSQVRDKNSLLNWLERAIRARKECPEFGYGKWELIETDEPSVFAHRCIWDGSVVLALHNLVEKDVSVKLKFGSHDERQLYDLLSDQLYDIQDDLSQEIDLGPYGYRWFRVKTASP